MRNHRSGRVDWPAGLLCAVLLIAPGWVDAQDKLTFAITLDAHNIGANLTAPTDTGIFVPAGAEISIAFGAFDMPWGESPVPFTLHAYLEGREGAAVPVTNSAPIRFDGEGQLRLVPVNVACDVAAGWGPSLWGSRSGMTASSRPRKATGRVLGGRRSCGWRRQTR